MTPSTIDPTDPSGSLPEVPGRRSDQPRTRVVSHALAADMARLHGDALLRTARRYAACADDAHDAYQRAMELLLEHAATIDRTKALGWMHVVIRREASALRVHHERTVPLEGEAVDEAMVRLSPGPEEHDHAIDLAQRAGEALATLKETEAQALCLRAQGMSYDEIGELYGWSYTKVNRAVTEGRRAFVDHYTAVESGVVCGDTSELISRFVAGELKPRVAMRMRAHLVRCSACRALLHAERGADTALRALLPPIFIAGVSQRSTSLGWLHDHLLAPIGHAAGRLQPAADHLIGSKIGLVAASTITLAGGGIAAERTVTHPGPPPKLKAGLVGASPSTSGTAGATDQAPIARVVNRAVDTGRTIERTAERRAAAVKRRRVAATRRKAAVKARRLANEREFAPAASEFASTTRSSAARAAKADTGAGRSTAAPTAAPATEVPTDTAPTDSTVDVTTEETGPTNATNGGTSDEFSP